MLYKIRVFLLILVISLINSAQAQENLIPMPLKAIWGEGRLDLSKGVHIKSGDKSLLKEHALLKQIVKDWGIPVVKKANVNQVPTLSLNLLKNENLEEEAYDLMINKHEISLSASTVKGLFYAIQTLKQFDIQGKSIQYASIQDKPAFSWRAYLIDVGRNYQPIDMIKEQIDVMANYKLNVLHFHFTEDIAWRLASKKYPGLTDASVMTRWKGQFYTESEFKELIQYCKDKQITLLPEVDMPGHSAAFKRYFGVDMQSDSGMMYIKELLAEFRQTYPEFEIFHIGGDEVKITNKKFMPEITKFVEELGYKKTIGWDPGSNLEPQTIRQMWMGGPKKVEEQGTQVYIESKHLYTNHMDPLETVTTLYHRMVGEQPKEHANFIGATLCSWPDRAVSKPIDMFYQSAIYPSIVTFAERIWQGGGRHGWVSNVVKSTDADYKEFVNFEKRLLKHKALYFADKPFPYVKQIGLKWDLIGPFSNDGNVQQAFAIEQAAFADTVKVDQTIEGGTVILKHWFGNIIQSALKDPKANTTWYARTKIWSEKEGLQPFWIGFDNFSRSYLTDSPKLNTWDNKGSKIFVNQQEIAPPLWKQAGQIGDREIPLMDEGYTFREPTQIFLKKGWNEVLLKLPVAQFAGRNWENPSKWMFTFVPITE